MLPGAILLARGHLNDIHGKTTHALVRQSLRYRVTGVVDPQFAGQDAGEVIDGVTRGIPVFASVNEALAQADPRPEFCVIGVATAGGVLPPALREDLKDAAGAGLSLVNGLHQLLADIPELAQLVSQSGGEIIDIRHPRPTRELRFWNGEVLDVPALRIPVLGTDCACGKRTTCTLLRDACREAGIAAEMVYTGQTGWLQGSRYGFIFDATPNDFVCGELERAIVECYEKEKPDVIFIEGQSSLRNPTGPCGSELLVAGAASGAILQYAAGRKYYVDSDLEIPIQPVETEVALIRGYGVDVWGITMNERELEAGEAPELCQRLSQDLGIPVVRPFNEGLGPIVDLLRRRLEARG